MRFTSSAVAAPVLTLALVVFPTGQPSANLIVNGSFEEPDVGVTGVQVIFGGSEPVGFGWTVNAGNVEVSGELYPPLPGPSFDGQQHLDLNGVDVGSLAQFFPTVAGTQYDLSFAYASNYAHHDPNTPAGMTVFVTDVNTVTQLVTPFPITHGTSSAADLDWVLHTLTFTAIGPSTGLGFASESRNTPLGGILLDGVVVVPEPGSASLLLLASVGLVALRRRKNR